MHVVCPAFLIVSVLIGMVALVNGDLVAVAASGVLFVLAFGLNEIYQALVAHKAIAEQHVGVTRHLNAKAAGIDQKLEKIADRLNVPPDSPQPPPVDGSADSAGSSQPG